MNGRSQRRALAGACLALAALAGASGGNVALADEKVSFTGETISVPGAPLAAFDIGFVDPRLGIYILADRSNSGVDVFSVVGQQFLFRVGGFAGPHGGNNDLAGPNGVVTVHHREIWAGDGNNATDHTQSSVKVIDLLTQEITDTIVIPNGQKRADEMAWDARDDILLIANDADSPPFITFISTKSHKVLSQIFFPEATNGIEQSQWSRETGLFYLNLPEVAPNGPKTGEGQIVVIDPKELRIVHRFTTHNCVGAGLALGPDNQAVIGCQGVTSAGVVLPNETQVIDLRNGHVVATFPQVGGADQVWFDRGDNHYYLAAFNNVGTGPVLGAIDAETLSFDNNVGTAARAHSVAADPIFDNVFVPLTAGTTNKICPAGCIGVYRHGPVDGDDRDADRGRDPRG
jgi:hypothetical protein